MEDINGYRLLSELTPDKSGFAKWGFAEKDGLVVFIKEFLSPVYPLDGTVLSREQILKKRAICKQFENEKRAFYNELGKCSTGNVVTALDFFRNASRYYLVTEKVDAAGIEPRVIAGLDIDKKILILKVILYNMQAIHQHGIVHGDIKPDNILLKVTQKGAYTAKIIDFDSSFLESNPPSCDDFQGDMVYFAPESFLYIAEEGGRLTAKIDVFALGILFHQYLSGSLPFFDTNEYDYVFEAVLDGAMIGMSPLIPVYIQEILKKMLNVNPDKRPDAKEVYELLTGSKGAESKKGESFFRQADDDWL